MTINVTPIPRLIELAAPSFTLGTANAAGSAITSIASDSTLLAFDTTVPTTIAYSASAAAGSSTVAPRRDHTHGMVAAPSLVTATARETYERTDSAGSGDQALTGAGFTPTWALFGCVVNNTALWSWGAIDQDGAMCSIIARSSTRHIRATTRVCALDDETNAMNAVWKSWDADGVTITWTKENDGHTTDFVVLFGK